MTGTEAEEDEAAPPTGSFQVLAIEIVVYSALVAAYLILVLRSLRSPLLEMAEHHRVLYGIAAVLLMLGQGVLLEFLTSLLVGRFHRARREEADRA
jgi:hypothetical protein